MRFRTMAGAGLSALVALAAGSAGALDANECSVGLWVKFDGGLFAGKSTEGSPTGLFDLHLDDNGVPQVTLKAQPTELFGDYALHGRDAVAKGEWHHYEISYSRADKTARFYVDGRFQWENDCLVMPKLREMDEKASAPTDGFKGEAKGLVTYPYAQFSEALLPAGGPDSDPRDTVAKRKHAAKVAANLAAISSVAGPAALYAVSPSSNTPYLPYDLPADGALTNVAELVTAPGEQESLSFVLVAKKPLVVKAGNVAKTFPCDAKIVKRWYRTGGAWFTYHADRRQRNLTPDLLLHDDGLVKVDELRRRNLLRFTYPEGTEYVDVSDPNKGQLHYNGAQGLPFEDAKTLQPVEIGEAGRNQQFYFTLDIPCVTKPGLYEIPVTFATSAGDVPAKFRVRVLDVALPEMPSPYRDLDRTYIAHMNHYPVRDFTTLAPTYAERVALAKDVMRSMATHRMYHATDAWSSDELVPIAKEAGMIPDRVHGRPFENPPSWKSFFRGEKEEELGLAEREQGIRASMRAKLKDQEWFKRTFPNASRQWSLYVSESSWYQAQHWNQEECGETAHRLGQRTFGHGGNRNCHWATDVQDMHANTNNDRDMADMFTCAGGEMINYADPFPGAENPMVFRYIPGWLIYRLGMNGHMLHGWLNCRTPFNEWAEDFGGDGNYRNFAMVYPQRNGILYTLCWDGVREGYADLRWLTRLKQLAEPFVDSDDYDLRTEAKRQLRWLESFQPKGEDVDMIRAGAQRRILVMQQKLRRHGVKLPPADRAYAKYRFQ